MRLHNGDLFWPKTLDYSREFKSAAQIKDHYDVLIIGGGMSGALAAYTLSQEGLTIAVADKMEMASGSSSANTGLLQFSNDIMLHELAAQIGEDQAVQFYKLCQKAVEQLGVTAQTLSRDVNLYRRKSICYASSDEDAGKLKKEYDMLKKHGFPADYWHEEEVAERMPFRKPAALITYGDAEVNPFRFIHGILEHLEQRGVDLFENTEIETVEELEDSVEVSSSIGRFSASHVLYATGYQKPPIKRKIGSVINRSFAIATNRVEDLSSWEDRALIWETKRPYLYLRTTADNRIIAGGLDENVPEAPEDEDWITNRAEKILDEVQELFPDLPLSIEYQWGASFGESADNLPYIGRHPSKRRQFYLLGYGGNGTVYSMLGSHLLKDLILGVPNKEAELLKLDR
ncbi:FAD-dependent oxidoreductase [Bacillus mangrovi]|uniref:FAD-dependent oxidoreductase n=1 Tax=Metabacillus mangrovi TaxID=1491830 RepID=A0A7X2S9D5_9BACI|nr:FAD-dependent oxidoreductase [Metabacillus mangrovi]MTH55086.1 FAD-dependent oxidoreductase [Metabacillus mangrovi]